MSAGRPVPSQSVVVRFEAELRRFIARRVPGPDADDVLQDALLRIHLGVGALRDQERLAPWVFRVARSAIIDHQRRHTRVTVALPEDATAEEEPEDLSGEARNALAACVAPFLEDLSPDQAEALRLTDLGGLTQVEAATRLGVPLPTLKARVQRGRRRLRASFEACCAFAQDARGAVVEFRPRCGCA